MFSARLSRPAQGMNCRLPAVILGCLLGAFAMAPLHGQSLAPSVDYLSNCIPTTQAIPATGLRNGDFENTTVSGRVAGPSWGSWQFNATSGIARENSPVAIQNGGGQAPNGDYVAFLAGGGQISVSTTLAAGSYRLRYFASRRNQSGIFDDQDARIVVNGVTLAQESLPEAANYESYASRPFSVSAGSVAIEFSAVESSPSSLVLIDNIILELVCDWDDPATWSPNGIPQPPDNVTVQVDHLVAFPSQATVQSITCLGELLTVDRNTDIFAADVMVSGPDALLEVGHRNVPFASEFTLTLTGTGTFTLGVNEKFLMAINRGEISMHGSNKKSWTRLLQDSGVGANSVKVEDATGWRIGDEIVIVGSEGQRERMGVPRTDFSERRTITNILPGTGPVATLLFDPQPFGPNALTSLHIGAPAPLSYTQGTRTWELENRAEVGILTRNVAVTSIDFGSNGFGGHIMIMRDNLAGEPAGIGRFSNVELSKLGQQGGLARYPMHWHKCKDLTEDQYVLNSSIHDTFNRAVTVHGTDNANVSDNFAYKNSGHAIFLEDGSEEDNLICRNLVVGTTRPAPGEETAPSDNEFNTFQNRSPASFWITNPQNTIDGNVAADTTGTGFWFTLPREVLGSSSSGPDGHNAGDIPNLMDLTSFSGNIAHGCQNGLDFHDGMHNGIVGPFLLGQIQKNLLWIPQSGSAVLDNFTAYACDQGVYSGSGKYVKEGGQISLVDCVFADNHIGTTLATSDNVRNCVFIAKSGPAYYQTLPLQSTYSTGEIYEAYRLYDGAGHIDDCHFVGYDHPESLMIGMNSAAIRSTDFEVANLTAVDINQVPTNANKFGFRQFTGAGVNIQDSQPGTWGFSIFDEDGSLTSPGNPALGYMGHSVTGNHPWMTDLGLNGVSLPGFFGHVAPYTFGHMVLLQPKNGANSAQIRCERRRVDNDTIVSSYQYNFTSKAFGDPVHVIGPHYLKQLPITVSDKFGNPPTVNDRHYYRLSWMTEFPQEAILTLQSMDPEDVAYLCFDTPLSASTAITGSSAIQVNSKARVFSLASHPNESVYFIDTVANELYLRVWNYQQGEFFNIGF